LVSEKSESERQSDKGIYFYFYFYFYFSVLKEATRLLLVDEILGDAVGPLICSHRGFFFFFLGS
jgi:hypothetical protein